MIDWLKMKKEAPVDLEKFTRLSKKAKQSIKFNRHVVDAVEGRKRVRNKMLQGKVNIFRVFSLLRKMVAEKLEEKDKRKADVVRDSFKGLRVGINRFESGKGVSSSGGITKGKPTQGDLYKYQGLLKRVLEEVILDNIQESAYESKTEEEFYDNIFEKIYAWAGTELDVVKKVEAEGEEEEEVGEVDEKELSETIGEWS